MDLEDIETVRERLQFRGAQGTTGSQATFLELFEGDANKIVQLNEVSRNFQLSSLQPANKSFRFSARRPGFRPLTPFPPRLTPER